MANKFKQITPIIRGTLAIKNMPNNLMSPMNFANHRQMQCNKLDVSQQPLLMFQPGTGAAVRFYNKATPGSSLKDNLPDKQQVEKYFFRTLAFVYDNTIIVFNWSMKNFQKYIVENPKVQAYWKMVHEKMEKAKHD